MQERTELTRRIGVLEDRMREKGQLPGTTAATYSVATRDRRVSHPTTWGAGSEMGTTTSWGAPWQEEVIALREELEELRARLARSEPEELPRYQYHEAT